MPIDLVTADALDALTLQIFDLHIVPNPNPALGYTTSGPPTGIKGQDAAIDQKLYDLIAPLVLGVDNRTLERVPYTINITMALKLRKKKWYIRGISELDSLQPFPASIGLEYVPKPGFVQGGNNSGGFTLGAAMCAAQCKIWSHVIRGLLAGTYPSTDEPAITWTNVPLGPTNKFVQHTSGLILTLEHWLGDPTSGNPAMIGTKFYADPTGNFPVDSVYEVGLMRYFNPPDLVGITR